MKLKEKTIAAISTAQGMGGIGVVRISGPLAIDITERIFKAASKETLRESKGYRAHFGHVISKKGERMDEAIATVFKAPKSYTGEDVVEISCHGSLYITREILRMLLKEGARPADPGEFTKRAFINGKIGLTEAEAVMDIIGSKNKKAAALAMNIKEGGLYRKTNQIKEEIVDLAGKLTVWADYPDEEDIVDVSEETVLDTLKSIKKQLLKLVESYDKGKILREGIYTVIVGRPNVGKSTIMNLLSNSERSIVTDVPGTTRDVIEETVVLGDIIMRLADTAGICKTKDNVEQIGISKAKEQIKIADLVLAMFDISEPLKEEDLEVLEGLKEKKTIAIANKSDLGSKESLEKLQKIFNEVIVFSASKGEGLKELEKAILKKIETATDESTEGILTTERQVKSAKKALKAVEEACSMVKGKVTFDAVTVMVEEAIDNLLELTGEKTSDIVVGNVFSKFCIGK